MLTAGARQVDVACKVYPWELPNGVRRDPKRSAEVRFYDALRVQLGQGWSVFYSVAWLGPVVAGIPPRDGEADFVLAHPQKGILVIELKGGRIHFDGDQQQWFSTDRHDVDHTIDPFGQARTSKHMLLNKLKELPALRGHWLTLGHAVAFPDVARPQYAVTVDAPPEIILSADDMMRLPQRIDEILAYWQGGKDKWPEYGPKVVVELTKLLARTTELPNPLSLQAAQDDSEIVRLTEEQFRVLDFLNRQRRAAIGGCAGSGKTFLAVEKARRLAREGYRTLLTCFNMPLYDFLKTITVNVEGLEVMNFHTLCSTMAKEAGLTLPEDWETPDTAAEVLSEALHLSPHKRYDAIVVDEGQDFRETWWLALEESLSDGKRSILYVFYDSHQRLYRGSGTLPASLTEIPLTENIRNTRSICQVLSNHYEGEDRPRPRGPHGRTVEMHEYTTSKELQNELARVLARLLGTERFSPQDLVVLTPKSLKGRSQIPGLKLPYPLRLVTDEKEVQGKSVLCSTIHRFKGLERKVAIVAEIDGDLLTSPERSALCYVAFSRPRTHLVLLGTPEALEVVRWQTP